MYEHQIKNYLQTKYNTDKIPNLTSYCYDINAIKFHDPVYFLLFTIVDLEQRNFI